MSSKTVAKILIATGNLGKVREISELLVNTNLHFLSLADFPLIQEVDETGSSFEENAKLKAAGYARQSGIISLADDSGLQIDALGGAPGVLSARYGGTESDFPAKMKLLLEEMERSADNRRSARFVCSMVMAKPDGAVLTRVEGICRGNITREPKGNSGFGYDPIFIPDGYEMTFGQLENQVKSRISHRALAVAKIMRYLLGFIAI